MGPDGSAPPLKLILLGAVLVWALAGSERAWEFLEEMADAADLRGPGDLLGPVVD